MYSVAFWPSTGGCETSVGLIASHLHDLGHTVTVFCQTPHEGDDPFPFRVVRDTASADLATLVRECDLVHLNAFHPRLFLQTILQRRRIVCTYRDLTMICPKGTKWKPEGPCLHPASPRVCLDCMRRSGTPERTKLLFRPAIKSALSRLIDANVCTSQFAFERYPLAKKRMIYNAIDTSDFIPGEGGERTPPQVVFAGRLIPEKGAQVLIEALRQARERGTEFRIAICGDGPYRPALEHQVEDDALQPLVRFHGNLDRPDLIRILQKSAIAVVPSVWDEPFGLTAIEAMSCGLPVVASDVGGLGRIVGEVGVTFSRGDAGELAVALVDLLADPELRAEMGRRCRRLAVQRYDVSDMVRRYEALYTSLLD